MKQRVIVVGLAVLLMVPAAAFAHDGHGVKKMGTITMAAPDHLVLKTTEGKEITIAVNTKTKVLRGKTVISLAELKEGTRVVVVVASGKVPFTASEITAGAPTPAKKK